MTKFDDLVAESVAKVGKTLTNKIKRKIFDPFDTVSVIGFLMTFKHVFYTNRTYE